MYDNLKSEIAAAALIRRAQTLGAYATCVHKGDPDAGAVYVAVRTLNGLARLYSPIRNFVGERAYLRSAEMGERDVDAKIRTLHERDPDLWVIEVEDRRGRHFLVEPVEER